MEIIREVIAMTKLKEQREIIIALPNDYQDQKEYPVLIINDGQNAFFDQDAYVGKSWGFLDYAQSMNLQVIMVAIPCNFKSNMREQEYGPWKIPYRYRENRKMKGGQGDDYLHFLIHDVRPFLESRFRVKDYSIVGSSMGAVISFYAFIKYPEIFVNCACLSFPIFIYEKQLLKLMNTNLPKNHCLYLDVGGDEGNGKKALSKSYLQSSRKANQILCKKNYHYEYHEFPYDHHNEYAWAKRVPYFMNLFYNS